MRSSKYVKRSLSPTLVMVSVEQYLYLLYTYNSFSCLTDSPNTHLTGFILLKNHEIFFFKMGIGYETFTMYLLIIAIFTFIILFVLSANSFIHLGCYFACLVLLVPCAIQFIMIYINLQLVYLIIVQIFKTEVLYHILRWVKSEYIFIGLYDKQWNSNNLHLNYLFHYLTCWDLMGH